MTDTPARSRFYGQYDTSIWPNRRLMEKAVMAYDTLNAAEKRRWKSMCVSLEIDPDVGL